jgi:hypothetical protein
MKPRPDSKVDPEWLNLTPKRSLRTLPAPILALSLLCFLLLLLQL